MARTYSVIDNGQTSTDNTVFESEEFTPTDNSLLLFLCMNSKSSTPDTPTISGFGLSWTLIDSVLAVSTASPRILLSAYYAQAGTGLSSGTITATYSATQSGFAYTVVIITDHDTGSPITQYAHNSGDSQSSFNVTLGSSLGADPLAIAVFGMATTTTVTHEWGSIATSVYTSPNRTMHTRASETSDTSANITTLSAATDICGIVVEISKAVATTGQPAMLRQLTIPFTSTIRAAHALRL